MARMYATGDQYDSLAEERWDDDEDLLQRRLRAASIEVESLTRFAVYDVDADGMPTDAAVKDAFAEATCAIVEHWQDTGDPRGVDAAQGAVKIGSVSIGTTSSSADSRTPDQQLARRIGDKAIRILTNAGLISALISYR